MISASGLNVYASFLLSFDGFARSPTRVVDWFDDDFVEDIANDGVCGENFGSPLQLPYSYSCIPVELSRAMGIR